MKRGNRTFKVSLQRRDGLQFTRYIDAPNGSVALDELLMQTDTRTTQIDRNSDNTYMIWCDEVQPTIWT